MKQDTEIHWNLVLEEALGSSGLVSSMQESQKPPSQGLDLLH